MRGSLLTFEIVMRINSALHATLGELIDCLDLRNITAKGVLLNYIKDQVYALKVTIKKTFSAIKQII